MNIKDSNKHFDKLSSFYAQVSSDGEINSIELELLKSYVLKFYESITTDSTTSATAATPKEEKVVSAAPIAAAPAPEVKTPPIAEQAPTETPAVVEEAPTAETVEIETPISVNSSELDALFSLETGNEISDKLSMAPIKDVTKAMNINEKIFTVKELFGGNKETFDATMNKLNGLTSYEEATNYLSEAVVEANGWLDPAKTKKVKTFLKLVARKYI